MSEFEPERLHLAGERDHRLLAVTHLDAQAMQPENHRQFDKIDADWHIGDAFNHQNRLDLIGQAITHRHQHNREE